MIASNNKLIQTFEAIKSAPCTAKNCKVSQQRVSLDEKLIKMVISENGGLLDKTADDYPTRMTETSDIDMKEDHTRVNSPNLSRKELFRPI